MIKVRDELLNVNILEELEEYELKKVRIRENELTACSPFRDEKSPSFSLNLDSGLWIDFGAGENSPYKRGNIVTLLSFLRNETPREVEEYLLSKYGTRAADVSTLELGINFEMKAEQEYRTISLEEYEKYAYRHAYLSSRGISEKVQRAFKVGYDRENKAVALAWQDIKGNIVNIKFRSVSSKYFYYYPTGQPVKNHIYGLYQALKVGASSVYVTEGEIDALYLWSNKIPAIALGRAGISKEQKRLILLSGIKEIVIASDNDKAGEGLKNKLIDELNGYVKLYYITLPKGIKDVNELPPDQLLEVVKSKKLVSFLGV